MHSKTQLALIAALTGVVGAAVLFLAAGQEPGRNGAMVGAMGACVLGIGGCVVWMRAGGGRGAVSAIGGCVAGIGGCLIGLASANTMGGRLHSTVLISGLGILGIGALLSLGSRTSARG